MPCSAPATPPSAASLAGEGDRGWREAYEAWNTSHGGGEQEHMFGFATGFLAAQARHEAEVAELVEAAEIELDAESVAKLDAASKVQ